jgi:hypothetical protein
MKKIGVLLLSVMMFLTSFVGFAKADTYDDMLKYAQDFNKLDFSTIPKGLNVSSYDWKLSSDMQNATFDGKNVRMRYTADVITVPQSGIRFIRVFNNYIMGFYSGLDSNTLYNAFIQKDTIVKNNMFLKWHTFPTDEPLYLDMFGDNGNPYYWYNSDDIVKQFVINRFNEIVNDGIFDSGLNKDDMAKFVKEYISDPQDYVGYASAILYDHLTPEQAKDKYNINNLPVAISLDCAYNSKEQFLNFPLKNTYIEAWRGEMYIYFKNLDAFKKALASGDLINNENSLFSVKINLKPNSNRILLNGQIAPPESIMGGINELTAKELPIAPVLKDGTTYVPVKGLFEELGAQVSYDDSTNTAIITKGNLTIKLKLGSNVVDVNGNKQQLSDTIPVINDHVLIPLRFVSEALGYIVKWDGNTQVITIEALDM